MKYCTDCGQKIEPIGGMPPKFCPHCGTPTNGVKAPTQKEATGHEDTTISLKTDLDMFEIEGSKKDSDAAVFKFEDIVGSQSEKRHLHREKGIASIDQFKARMTSKNPIDA